MARPLAAGTVSLVSAAEPGLFSDSASGPSFTYPDWVDPALQLSADGRYAVFVSTALNVVPGQDNGEADPDSWTWPFNDHEVFLFDRVTGSRTLVSHSRLSAAQSGNYGSGRPALSADGRFVAFVSSSNDLVAGQTESGTSLDVFLFDRTTGAITLVSHAAGTPATATGQDSDYPSISADGRYVAFESRGGNQG